MLWWGLVHSINPRYQQMGGANLMGVEGGSVHMANGCKYTLEGYDDASEHCNHIMGANLEIWSWYVHPLSSCPCYFSEVFTVQPQGKNWGI